MTLSLLARTAAAISDGKVVGWFHGRMEFGPRALGNRSIIASPCDTQMFKHLNTKLGRTEFMPFAPVIMEEFADEILVGYQNGIDNAPFMTNCWEVKEEWRSRIPSVVHIDGTCRPQVIKRETNPYYYSIIEEFYKKTGVPVLINTSFNSHEEPIVCFQHEAESDLKTFKIEMLVEK